MALFTAKKSSVGGLGVSSGGYDALPLPKTPNDPRLAYTSTKRRDDD